MKRPWFFHRKGGRPQALRRSMRTIAALEASKGIVVLLAASGVLLLIHENLHQLAARLIEHAHLNPAASYPRIFLDAADQLQNVRLRWLAVGAAVYSAMRFTEAWGLFYEKAWAEVLAALSGAIYLPFEIAGLLRHFSWLGCALLSINLLIVFMMLAALSRR